MTATPNFNYGTVTQLTQKQAIAFAESGTWRDWDFRTRALFQVHQNRMCIPLEEYYKALSQTLGRDIYRHEPYLNQPQLREELMGVVGAPCLDQIIALLPQNILTVVAY
jgi:hypothetical protein